MYWVCESINWLNGLCWEFMQVGDTLPFVDDVPYFGQGFNAVQIIDSGMSKSGCMNEGWKDSR